MKKILIVFGTRPEAIKLCPLVLELLKHPADFKTVVCVTAQHREMLDQVLNIFDIKPDHDLNLMRDNQTLFDITSNCITQVGKVIENEKPDILIVQGDTTTTFSSALAAFYSKVKIGHVEAGLRTFNKYSPFPEEINRKLTTGLADVHFAPTEKNNRNLLSEGVAKGSIVVTGNTVIDALLWVRDKIVSENKVYEELNSVDFSKRIILVTGHRRENFGQGFIDILTAIREVAENNSDVEVVYPVHYNPNVRKPVNELLKGVANIRLIEPLDYEPFIYIMDKSYLIISDSGGVQEEAPSLGKPVLVTRDTTERPEAVDTGVVKLVGVDKEKIVLEAQALLDSADLYNAMSNIQNPYGDGHACENIVMYLKKYFSDELPS